jgi:hypothetical protein
VTRHLGPDTIVICDSPNYIKGFRYQMYCAAREAHARVCTVSCTAVQGPRATVDRLSCMSRLLQTCAESGKEDGDSTLTNPRRESCPAISGTAD